MNTINQARVPTFNLKAVVRKTGVKAHTLRSWEQRYGLPRPERTDGGHRRYSQYDIDVVRWLSARLREDMTISRAVELWDSLEAAGEDPFSTTTISTDEYVLTPEMGTALSDLRKQWMKSCLAFDEPQADRVLTQAFSLYPVTMVCIEILQRGLSEIGEMWFLNEVTVQQEHFTAALTIKRLDALLAAAPLPTRLGRILLACPPQEEHTFPLLLLSLLLIYQGWHVVYLGANVPIMHLDRTIDVVEPDLVVMSAQLLRTAASLAEVAEMLTSKGCRVGYGGLVFSQVPSSRQHVSGFYLGNGLSDAVQAINQILLTGKEAPQPKPVPEGLKKAARDYRTHHALIEWDVRWLLEMEGIPYEQLAATNARLADAIVAALNLGDLTLANTEIELGLQLMRNYGIATSWQVRYFTAYFRAAYKHLGDDSAIIINWMDEIRSSLETQ